jgi:hypothetical protein
MAFGAMIKNDTGGVLNGIKISLKGEFWRSSDKTTNKLTFGYGLVDGSVVTADNFLTASANGLTSLNIVGPAPVTTVGPLNGDDPTNQKSFTDIYVGAALPAGAVLFIRWTDVDDDGNDAGLAVDDLQITASTGPLPADGLAAVSLANGDANFNSLPLWLRGSTNQVLRLNISGTATSGTINTAEITLPAGFINGLATNSISVEGTGRGSNPVVSLVSNVLTVAGLAADNLNPGTVVITNLSVPQTTNSLTNDGNYSLTIKTQTGEGALQTVANPPVAYVTIPMANLGDVDANGVSLDVGKTVAVEGVCTEENFISSSSTSAYLQSGQPDGTNKAGINVYSTLRNLFVRSNSYVVMGSVLNYYGLTEVVITNSNNVINQGLASNQPTPVTLTIGQLTNAHEAYEGSLVRVVGLSKATNGGTWAFTTNTYGSLSGANILLQNGGTNLTARLNVGSTATREPIYPAAITGIYGQFVSNAPFVGGGQIQPRDAADIEDAPGLRLSLVESSINEGGSYTSTTLTIERIGGTSGVVNGTLGGVPSGKVRVQGTPPLSLPYSFSIPDGEASIQVTLEAIDNATYGGDVLVGLTASDDASVLVPGTASLTVLENETAGPVDTTPPVITLTGSATVTVAWGGSYSDAGATATDNVDSPVTVNSSGTVNTAVPGTYTITYTASDVAGNAATPVTRTVTVSAPANTPGADGLSALLRYAFGGNAPGDTVTKPSSTVSGGNLVLTAIVRTNDAKLAVVGEAVKSLADYTNAPSITTVNGSASGVDQTGSPAGCERQAFTVPQGADARKFLRLKATLAP